MVKFYEYNVEFGEWTGEPKIRYKTYDLFDTNDDLEFEILASKIIAWYNETEGETDDDTTIHIYNIYDVWLGSADVHKYITVEWEAYRKRDNA